MRVIEYAMLVMIGAFAAHLITDQMLLAFGEFVAQVVNLVP
jgi:sorbitol-specific phosphotransferase system component IIA